MNQAVDYDLTIIGGGLVGATLALSLRGSGLRIALVEAVDRQASSQPSYDDRTLVLNRVSCDWLHQADLWSAVSDAATAIQRIHVSAKGRFGQTQLRAAQHGLSEFGFVVQARRLGMAMIPAVAAMSECEMFCPAALEHITAHDDHAQVHLRCGEDQSEQRSFTTRLVVGADGAQSKVRHIMGLPAHEYDYQQTAVISNISAEQDHQHCAYERFTDTGPLALLPHGPGRMGLVWSVARDAADELLQLDDAAFLAGLQQRYGYRLGLFKRVGRRSAYPLKLVHVREPVAPRSVLIGNAAHTIHPISAQGFNLGLRDAVALAEQLRQSTSQEIGSAATLRAYQALRDDDQQETIRYTDGLVRLYRHPSTLFRCLGSAALLAHQYIPAMQRRLVTGAMGYRGRAA